MAILFYRIFRQLKLIRNRIKDCKKIQVVILIGAVTRSSGNMTAIAFKGRPNTYFIGEPTEKGYTTSNGYFQFAFNLTLNFSTNFCSR